MDRSYFSARVSPSGAGSGAQTPFSVPLQRIPSHEAVREYAASNASSSGLRSKSSFLPLLETPHPLPPPLHKELEFLVVSGGSGANAVAPAFTALGHRTTFVLPISDNGGSSSEIIRVIGGPSIGDIRSRLIRLIPAPTSASDVAIKRLLEYRMSGTKTSAELKAEWLEIVEGHSGLWRDVLPERREVIRSFLVHFESELLKRANKRFSFRQGSIGNMFLAGAMIFFRSLESAIFMFCSITRIPTDRLSVLPCIHTNSVATISAELEDGGILTGQMEISHPPSINPERSAIFEGLKGMLLGDDDALGHGLIGRAFEDESSTMQDDSHTLVSKDDEPALPSRIRRIYYINSYGQEVYPKANPNFMMRLNTAACLLYCCGSLWTSIAPCLALHGVGFAIANSVSLRYKILMLNSKSDRETPADLTAVDMVQSLRRILNYKSAADREQGTLSIYQASDYVTHVLYLEGGELEAEVAQLELLGIKAVKVRSSRRHHLFDRHNVAEALESILDPSMATSPASRSTSATTLTAPSPLRTMLNA